jgi:hypothetical protein
MCTVRAFVRFHFHLLFLPVANVYILYLSFYFILFFFPSNLYNVLEKAKTYKLRTEIYLEFHVKQCQE